MAATLELELLQDGGDPWSVLLGIMDRLSLARTLEEVSLVVAAEARKLVDADGVTFVLRDGEQCHYLEENAVGPLWRGLRFPMSACISGWCMLHGKTAEVPDIELDERIPLDAYRPTFVRSLVMVPVGRPTPLAAIGAYWATRREPNARSRRIMETLARCAGTAIVQQRLNRRLAETQERMMVALEENDLGIWQLDMEDLALSTSLACRAHLGRSGNSSISYADLLVQVHPDDRTLLQTAISDLARYGGDFRVAVRLAHFDGVPQRIELRAFAEPDIDQPAQRIMGLCRPLP